MNLGINLPRFGPILIPVLNFPSGNGLFSGDVPGVSVSFWLTTET